MTENLKVSSITACYKKKEYLQKFLEELPRQTYFSNLEIVFDHNEPDADEFGWVEQFKQKYPKNIRHIITQPVEPLGVSWNRCIRESMGDLLITWNIDDLRTPDSIEQQAEVFRENPDIDIVAGNFIVVPSFPSEKGIFVDVTKYPPIEFTKTVRWGPFFMFRKKLLETAGYFDEQFRCANDFDLSMRLLFHGRLKVIDKNMGYFLDERKGASTKPNSVCPVEGTAIQLRYGNYDRIDYHYLPAALKYNIYNMKVGDEWIPISRFIPDYENYLQERFEKLSRKNFMYQWKESTRRRLSQLLRKLRE